MEYFSVLISLIIAIVVAVITSNLSLRGFYKQEIWLRKETKYSQIIDSLSKLQRYYGNIVDDISGNSISDNIRDEADVGEYKIAKRELELLASSPILMTHKDVSDILNDLVISASTKTKEESSGDYFSYYDRLWFESKEAKIKIAAIANKDLGIGYSNRFKKK